MKKRVCMILAGCLAMTMLGGCAGAVANGGNTSAESKDNSGKSGKGQVVVYNWGEYIDEDVIDMFEEETGIEVVYDMFETNEEMYPKIETGAVKYDVVCPYDYIIEKMIQNNLIQKINWDNVPNIKNMGDIYMEMAKEFDPENEYAVPYNFGTVGIMYNTTMVDEPVDSWSILWDEKYKDSILMQKSVRDAFAVALKLQGHSLNTDVDAELQSARDLLIEQKPLVQAYVIDQVRDKMIGGEAALGVIYSGEYLFCKEENPDLEYVVPKEGSNFWLDGWVIPANAENKENAEAWINFMCREDIALRNFEYITYSTPNEAAQKLIDPEILNDPAVFPDDETIRNCEVFHYLGADTEALYNQYWSEVLSN